jgi:hypothetical protein
MRQTVLIVLSAILVFAAVAAAMIKLMPDPLGDSDYLVIGSVSTLAALLAVFLALVSTKMKSRDVFFKKRKKK